MSMFVRKGIRWFFQIVFFVMGVSLAVLLYHLYAEPFLNTHPEYIRWISDYDISEKVTVIEKEEKISITESDFVPRLIVNSQGSVVTLVSSSADTVNTVVSGFFITNDGVVVVPNRDEFFEEGSTYRVFSVNGDEYEATRIGFDPFLDLAFFRTGQKSASVLTFAPQDAFFVGRNIVLLSRSLEGNAPVAQTSSLVEWAQRTNIAKQSIGSSEKYEGVGMIKNGDFAQEGSAVVTYQGELLGMARDIFSSQNRSRTGILPIQAIVESLNSLDQNGNHQRPFLGISYVSLTPELANMYKLPVSYGAWVRIPKVSGTVVLFGSPAYLSGILQGDIITAVNGVPLTIHTPLSVVISRFHPNEKINLRIYRSGTEREISVTLGQIKEKLMK